MFLRSFCNLQMSSLWDRPTLHAWTNMSWACERNSGIERVRGRFFLHAQDFVEIGYQLPAQNFGKLRIFSAGEPGVDSHVHAKIPHTSGISCFALFSNIAFPESGFFSDAVWLFFAERICQPSSLEEELLNLSFAIQFLVIMRSRF